MENETQNQITEDAVSEQSSNYDFLSASILISTLILAGAWVYTTKLKMGSTPSNTAQIQTKLASASEKKVLPSDGVVLPVLWGDLGAKMTSVGVIDGAKFEQLYTSRGGLDGEAKNLLYGESSGNLKITSANSGMILNLLWALGLGNKNDILEQGPMMDSRYGGAGNFASTGGWSLAKGDAMEHYSRHPFIVLTPEQQKLVERVSKNIYRPCCDNATYFPDCNHGMAMLGFLELMASQGVSEDEMYKAALAINSYWFPDTYFTIAAYMKNKGVRWQDVNPREMLSKNYSSASGYPKIASQVVQPKQQQGGSGCGVESGQSAILQEQKQGGCGI